MGQLRRQDGAGGIDDERTRRGVLGSLRLWQRRLLDRSDRGRDGGSLWHDQRHGDAIGG